MGLVDAIKKALGRPSVTDAAVDAPKEAATAGASAQDVRAQNVRAQNVRVPEVTSTQLMAELSSGEGPPLLLDIRENFERAQSYIPDSLHIPMNSVPYRLAEIDPHRDLVVYCAHGNRSYGVAGWLIQQGYNARSLKGGIVDWQGRSGPVKTRYPGRS